MSIRTQLIAWSSAALVLVALLWLMSDILLPFVTGAAIAYFLNPVVLRLMGLGVPRMLAVAVLMALALGVVVLAALLIIPAIIGQLVELTQAAPDLLRQLQELASIYLPAMDRLDSQIEASLANLGDAIRERGAALAQGVLRGVSGFIQVLIFLVITPVVAVYLLVDWPRVMAAVDDLLPRNHAPVLRDLGQQIDRSIAGFVRGQVTVCLILAVYYASSLGLAGLQFGLAIGAVAGLISFIPYIGAILGGALAIGVALWQFWGEPGLIAVVVVIFGVGQILEGNILVPRIVGKSVQLHPVWLLFALSAFGSLYGFTGMLIAVPLAAAIGVIVRFGVAQYQASALYGADRQPPDRGD